MDKLDDADFSGCLPEDDLEKIVLRRRDFKKLADSVFLGAFSLVLQVYETSSTPLIEDYAHKEEYLQVLELFTHFVNEYGRIAAHPFTLKIAEDSLEYYSQLYSRIKSIEQKA